MVSKARIIDLITLAFSELQLVFAYVIGNHYL